MFIVRNMPKPLAQWSLLVLLAALALVSSWTLILILWAPDVGRIYSPSRWAGTAAGIAVCSAFFQFQTTKWIEHIVQEYGDDEKYPYGPPSHVTRIIIDNPDQPRLSAIRNLLFYDTSLTAVLGLWAGAFTILSYWVD